MKRWMVTWSVLACATAWAADPAVRPFEDYQVILDRQPFGTPPDAPAEPERVIPVGESFAASLQLSGIYELEDGNHAKYFLIAYFGKVKTDESRDIVLPHLDRCANIVIPTLIKMNATGVRHLIEPHLKSSWPPTRRYARRAMERLT